MYYFLVNIWIVGHFKPVFSHNTLLLSFLLPHLQFPLLSNVSQAIVSEKKDICIYADVKIKQITLRFKARQDWHSADKNKASSLAFQSKFRRYVLPCCTILLHILTIVIELHQLNGGSTNLKQNQYHGIAEVGRDQ